MFILPHLYYITIIGVLLFPSADRDDVYITYWAAYSLSNFGEILNSMEIELSKVHHFFMQWF
jgi:hypothetical protein